MSTSQLPSQSPDKGSRISNLPNEILDNIIVSIINNVTPVQFEYLVNTANHLTMWDIFGYNASGAERFDPYQLQHQQEWVIVSSVCRRWQYTGRKAFFSLKTFVITTVLLKALVAGRHKLLTSPNLDILVTIRHVVAPMSGRGASDYLVLPRYPHAFSNLQRLDVLTYVGMDDILREYCVPRFWTYPRDKEPYRELMECLAGIGFQVEGLDIGFPRIRKSVEAEHVKRLLVDVLPNLRFVSTQKAKSKAQVTE
ncbi:MAG: hypothetical protein Q9205_005354 [Flavoplaca limonia]